MACKKPIFKINTLKKLLNDANSCISLVPTTRLLALPPFFLNDMKSGILYLLNNMLKKYDRSLGGIVIGYQNIKVLMDESTGIIPMGTSETEVNIKVEFYIFQPKIGSFLEGVVNKKSSSHIGCLVHRYFNATILKPEDVDYDEWICQNINVDDKIIFRVKDLDFTGLLPLIEGMIDDEQLLDKTKSDTCQTCDTSDNSIPNKINKNDTITAAIDNVKKSSLKFDSGTALVKNKIKIKKKKKEKRELLNLSINCNQTEKEKRLGCKETISDTLNEIFKVKNTYHVHKQETMNEKKRKNDNLKIIQGSSKSIENIQKGTSKSASSLDEIQLRKDETVNNSEKHGKLGELINRRNKKKNELEEPQAESNEINRCLSSNEEEDDVFYSTQLDSFFPKKMKISCCSPICKTSSFEEKSQKGDFENGKKVSGNDMKQNYRKRKIEKEKESEDLHKPKIIKSSHIPSHEEESSKTELNVDGDKSIVQATIEELCKKQFDRISKELRKAEEDRSKERKKKKKRLKNEKKEILNLNKKNIQVNGQNDTEQNPYAPNPRVKQRTKNVLNFSDKESCDKIKKLKKEGNAGGHVFSWKEVTENPLYGTDDVERKSSVQIVKDQLLNQGMNTIKENFKKSGVKGFEGEKNARTVTNEQDEISGEKIRDSLFEKLLNEAKTAMDLEENESRSLPHTKWSKQRKKNLSNLKNSSNVRGKMKKTDKESLNPKDCHETPVKYRNGSMYDVEITPEKVNFEKSLFSDSEQSTSSPAKMCQEMNKTEAEVLKRGLLKKKEDMVKNGCTSKKVGKSNESERKQEQEYLYEKLLMEAKNLIQSKSECSLKKKKKANGSPKNHKSDCKVSVC